MPRNLAQWTGIAVAAIVVSGSDMDLLLAVPLGILAGALVILFFSLAERVGQLHQAMIGIFLALIGRGGGALAKIPLRAVGACVVALFVGMWIGNSIETGRALAPESAFAPTVVEAPDEQAEDARPSEAAAVPEVQSQSQKKLDDPADADEEAEALASDAQKQVVQAQAAHSAARAELREEQLINQGLLSTNAMLMQERDNLKDEVATLALEHDKLAEENDNLRRVCGPACNSIPGA